MLAYASPNNRACFLYAKSCQYGLIFIIDYGNLGQSAVFGLNSSLFMFQLGLKSDFKQIAHNLCYCIATQFRYLDGKAHWANMRPTWGRQDPGGPHENCYLGVSMTYVNGRGFHEFMASLFTLLARLYPGHWIMYHSWSGHVRSTMVGCVALKYAFPYRNCGHWCYLYIKSGSTYSVSPFAITVTLKEGWWRHESPASQLFTQTFVQTQIRRKYQSSASLALVRGNHQWPVNCPHKGPVTQKMFPFDGVFMLLGL